MDVIPCYNVGNYHFNNQIETIITKKKNGGIFAKHPITFDIESTTFSGIRDADDSDWILEPYGIMYHWQLCFEGDVILGRTWSEYYYFLERLKEHYPNIIFACYVHNLGFEWQFLSTFESNFNMFATRPHHPLYVRCDNIEYRCSYLLSNMSLEKFVESQDQPYIKASGDLDYDVVRYSSTILTVKETSYCIGDVLALYWAIVTLMASENDNIASIPMTSTGYVRREVRNAVWDDWAYRDLIKELHPTPQVYRLLKMAGAGGDTHANRYLSGRLWRRTCDSFDAKSSYPYVLTTKKFPVSAFQNYGEVLSWDVFRGMIDNYACLFRLQINGIRIKPDAIDPVLQTSKGKIYKDPEGDIKTVYDNGRILQCYCFETVMTDIDFKEFEKFYDYESITVGEFYYAKYGYLPEKLRRVIIEYFVRKCELEIAARKDPEIKYYYNKIKNRINSIFGMMYTDPVHNVVWVDEDNQWHEDIVSLNDIQQIADELEKHAKSKANFLSYAWGIWTTCHARAHLHRLILAGTSDGGCGCYWDTDSLKGFNLNEIAIDHENADIRAEDVRMGAYCEIDGERFYLGVFAKEEAMNAFITLGSKKYAYTDGEDNLHITISGVNKKRGAAEMRNIKKFKNGFVFREGAAKRLIYTNGHRTGNSVAVLDNTYTIGITSDYDTLIKTLQLGGIRL